MLNLIVYWSCGVYSVKESANALGLTSVCGFLLFHISSNIIYIKKKNTSFDFRSFL